MYEEKRKQKRDELKKKAEGLALEIIMKGGFSFIIPDEGIKRMINKDVAWFDEMIQKWEDLKNILKEMRR